MGILPFFLILLKLCSFEEDTQIYPPPVYHFLENFESLDSSKWISSNSYKSGSPDMKYTGVFSIKPSSTGNGLLMETPLSHHGLSAKLQKPFDFSKTDSLYFQFIAHHQTKPDCGGAYIKLLSSSSPLSQLDDTTPFSIMFGPDTCGGNQKLHFIINFPNPVTGKTEEKLCKSVESFSFDSQRHLYTLSLHVDGSYMISVDTKSVLKGNILTDMTPPINPPKLIPDPSDKRPDNWDDREEIIDESKVKPDDWDEGGDEMIPDLNAVKPSDWKEDSPLLIPDKNAIQPEDWDNELDGDWERPLINNPECVDGKCGEWMRPLKVNPKYKGPWKPSYKPNPNYMGLWFPANISNPEYFYESKPYKKLSPITAVALELWTVEANVMFDDIILTSDANSLANWTFQIFPVRSTPISDYVKIGLAYLSAHWTLIGCIGCVLVLFLLLLRWIRPSNVPDEPEVAVEEAPQVSEVEETVQVSEAESDDEGARQRQ